MILATLFFTLIKEHCIESYVVGKIRSEARGKVLSIVMSLFETLSSEHRVMKKNFETELWIDKHKSPLNHFVQETLANVLLGFLKTLKETDEFPTDIKVKIKKLARQIDVDAHTYP